MSGSNPKAPGFAGGYLLSSDTKVPDFTVYDDEARKKLFDKINRVAANLGYDHARTPADGAPESADSKVAAGHEEEKEKTPWGVGASL